MEADIKIIDVVDSTNTELEKLANEGAPEGTCVLSFCQRKGQGRSGRSFFSPKGGNLYMSLLLRGREKDTDLITPAAAVAVVRSIKDVFAIDTGIKWVNDIMLEGKKVCGIIAKAHGFGTGNMYVILGIGINIYRSENIPEEIANIYGSLFDHECDISETEQRTQAVKLAKTIIGHFDRLTGGSEKAEVSEEYRKNSAVIGKRVEYFCGDNVISATVADIDSKCRIVLESGGVMTSYRDGEIRINCEG